ncbi:MAG: hypothetical protein ACSHYB_07265 [Roseibacillus sp.]
MKHLWLSLFSLSALLFASCGVSGGAYTGGGSPNMGGPTADERKLQIATEPRGDFFYGRRYHVKKTRFWGFIRKPGQDWTKAKLVVFNEKMGRQPDRYSEIGPPEKRYGFDNNYEYRIKGYFSGEKVYEINSNQFLPEFVLTGYELLDKDPGWLFSPQDHFDHSRITLTPRF